jgi:hypothetical protein
MVEHLDIEGLPIFVFERHNWALLPWAQVSRKHPELSLISLDHHTDSLQAFARYCHRRLPEGYTNEQLDMAMDAELAKVQLSGDEFIVDAVTKLQHDEQIQAALRLKIFQFAFVISFQSGHDDPRSAEQEALCEQWDLRLVLDRLQRGLPCPELPLRPFKYPRSPIGLYLVGHACIPDCEKSQDDDECLRLQYDAAIDSVYLRQQLSVGNEMATTGAGRGSCYDRPYVLDIDLDVFHTRKAVTPADPSVFHELIRGAVAITIARENDCVSDLQLEGEDLTSSWLLDQVLDHIRQARTPTAEP